MDIEFKKLINLQGIDVKLIEVSHFLEEVPSKLKRIDKKIDDSFQIVVNAEDKLATNQKRRRDAESEVQDTKTLISKYKKQLSDVRTNKEYTSLLHEISEIEKQGDILEEKIISEMLLADDIEEEIKSATQKAEESKAQFTKEKDALLKKKEEQEVLRANLLKEKEALLPNIPSDQIKLYNEISSKCNGIALSPVTGEFCSMCHMRIRPQVLNELKEENSIILCENCGRIIHF
ncbi:MAG: C4-type zinc ribbon domain-containing protein [Candidatus Aminicenantes bacterium]|nr:C4-type zinc ribbon domain-containing protein [Candidatus Aminicenantes bacterium]